MTFLSGYFKDAVTFPCKVFKGFRKKKEKTFGGEKQNITQRLNANRQDFLLNSMVPDTFFLLQIKSLKRFLLHTFGPRKLRATS